MRRQALSFVARGIPEARVTVIPNAVNLAAFPFAVEQDAALKRQLGVEGNTVIGFIGSFYAYEGLDLLLRALPQVLERVPHARVLLVGGGPHEPALRSLSTIPPTRPSATKCPRNSPPPSRM